MKKLFLSLCMFNSIAIMYSADNQTSLYHDAIIKDNILECPSLSITLNLDDIDPLEVQTYKELMKDHTPLVISRYSILVNNCCFNKYAYGYSFFDWQNRTKASLDPTTDQPIEQQAYFSIETIKDKVFIRNLGNNPLDPDSLLYQYICYESQQGNDRRLACRKIAQIYKQERDFPRIIQWLDREAHIEKDCQNIPLQDPETAITRLRKLADAGNVRLQAELGYIYKCNNDLDNATTYLTMAAQAGNKIAMGELGNLYAKKHDFTSAALWYEQAAMLGHAQATANRALLYEQAQDIVQAFTWYEKAAELGCVTLDLFYILSKASDIIIDHNLYRTYLQTLKQNNSYVIQYREKHPQRYAQACEFIEQLDAQFFQAITSPKKEKEICQILPE